MANITTILSDLGNVVVRFDNGRTISALERLMRTAPGSSDGVSDVASVLLDMRAGLWNLFERGMFDGARAPRVIAAALGISDDARTLMRIERAWTDIFTLHDPVVELWRDLRAKRYILTATSNIDALRYTACARLGVSALFDHEVLSFEEGMLKQDGREFFVRALDRSGCKAEEAFYVDDRQDCLDVASALGIHTFLYDYRDHKALLKALMLLGVPVLAGSP